MTVAVRALVASAALLGVSTASAQQTAPRLPAATAAQVQARREIAALEAVLENAVRYGAQMLDQRLRAETAANHVMLAGMARARGFRLDDYGVVFDVEFPSMRRSMVWSLQELERSHTGRVRASGQASSVQPREIYQAEITEALANALLDYTGAIGIAPHEWLTVAARESVVDRRLVPGDVAETSMTVMLRIKGGDLQAVRDRTLSRDEARKRLEVKHY